MISNIVVQNIQTNNSRYYNNRKQLQAENTHLPKENGSAKLLNTLDCLGAISFGSVNRPIRKFLTPEVLENFRDYIAINSFRESNVFNFLMCNPRGFYLNYGREVNKFLRSGSFGEFAKIDNSIPEALISYFMKKNVEDRILNRTILESIDILDTKMSSTTQFPMTVYRDAPKSWLKTAKDGYLTDAAYCSTSTEKGASLEGIICNGADNFTYEIRLPKGTPYWDLTDTTEKEMLLPRNCKFKIVSDGVLELVL